MPEEEHAMTITTLSATILLAAATHAFEAKVDETIESEMKREGVPGVAFVYVKDGRIAYMKGYGLANVDENVPVDPAKTIWRIGSISKTFTATAVMQLVERGRVQLEGDVASYLSKVKVPPSFPLPITVGDLLTHTGGLDEIRPGTQAPSEAEVLGLSEFLKTRLQRVRPPGTTISYSTYGTTLAGELVEEVTQKPFEEYLRENVWSPLGMTRTSIRVPPELAEDLAVGYEREKDALVPQAWEWYHTTPASSINSTALDMAHYMIALLEEGRYGSQAILAPGSVRAMQRQQRTMHPLIPGVTYGLWEDFVGSLRFTEHGGNVAGFSAQMVLVPSERAGFFVVGQLEGSNLRDTVKWTVLENLFPAARTRLPAPSAPKDFAKRAAAFTGRYAPSSSCHTCEPRSVPYILEVTADDEGLLFRGSKWIETAPLVFERNDGTGYICFQTDAQGNVVSLHAGSYWNFEKLN
jgi:CubicO group peptidase (beta-lactamase class C family)